MFTKVEKIINEKIRPGVQMDGGDIQLIDIENGIVFISLQGACEGCPSSSATLYAGIQRILQAEIPEIKGVIMK